MAWTDQCKIACEFGIRAKLKMGLNKTEAFHELSKESDIPYKTLRNWHYNKPKKSPETGTTIITPENNSTIKENMDEPICAVCKINPPRAGHTTCTSCQNKSQRAKSLKQLKGLITQVNSMKELIIRDGTSKYKWMNDIRKNEYEQFINILIETVKVWEDLLNGTKIES